MTTPPPPAEPSPKGSGRRARRRARHTAAPAAATPAALTPAALTPAALTPAARPAPTPDATGGAAGVAPFHADVADVAGIAPLPPPPPPHGFAVSIEQAVSTAPGAAKPVATPTEPLPAAAPLAQPPPPPPGFQTAHPTTPVDVAPVPAPAAAPALPSDATLPPLPPSPVLEPAVPSRGTRARQRLRARAPSSAPWFEHGVLALLSYVPLLVVDPGVVTSDTKTYLYLDPSRFLSQVGSMWNPTVALGTVTHEYIGYLFPMGPFYVLTAALHIPTWIAQRLWLGTILFAAGAGVLYLCRHFSLRGPGRLVAATAFMLSPYFLQYSGRISVILLPWAGLPWMVAFAALALRRGGWKYPALFAVVVASVSGINASSLIYVGVAPLLWIIYAVAVEREGTWGQAVVAALKIGFLSLLCCLWWIAGLDVEAAYGVDVLKYTETVPSTSSTSTAADVVRGLGYWYFYGADRLGPWTASSLLYTQQVWLVATSYALPVFAFISAVFTRWRHRAYYVLLLVVGVVLSVGAHPFTDPTPVGGLLKSFMTNTTAGLAMRSTDRATPLVVLATAMLLGSGVSALWRRLPTIGAVTGLALVALVVANNPAMFNGDAEVASDFVQPASLPAYQMAAIHHLNATHPGTRVLAIPGNDFASDRWGDTVDTPQPAYLTRPFVTREQQIMGSEATADTLFAIDGPIQTGTENWPGFAQMARLLSAGDVLVEYDQAYEHYGVPQPEILAASLATTPQGLSDPQSFGTPVANIADISTLDENDLATTPNPAWPSPLVTYTVTDPRPITRGESDTRALIVAGDATGLQDAADAGLLDTDSAIYYAGTLDGHRTQLDALLAHGATLVVTDTNRKQGFRWDTLTANYGITETATEHPTRTTLSDSPIDLFPSAPTDAHALGAFIGAVNVTASSYGNPISYTPEYQPSNAIDGDGDTSWETGTFVSDPVGQWWQVQFATAKPADHITIDQPIGLDRWITRVTLSFTGHHDITVDLTKKSRTKTGQTIVFPTRTFRTLRITIDATTDDHATQGNATAIGFQEVTIPNRNVVESVVMPADLLKAAGAASINNALVLTMARERASEYPPRSDPENSIVREFTLPTARTFTLTGSANVSALIPDDEIDRLLGMPGTTGSGVIAYSQSRSPGDLHATAASTIDTDPATAWQPGFGASHQKTESLQFNLGRTLTFSHMDLKVLADGRHSVPTTVTITASTATKVVTGVQKLTLPPIADSRVAGAYASVPFTFPPLTGRRITVTVSGSRIENTSNYYSAAPIAMPLGIATLGIPGLHAPALPSTVPGYCQSNLLEIDGQPISIRITGSTTTALHNGTLHVSLCGPDANGITLAAGPHILQTYIAHRITPTATVPCPRTGTCTGWNINQLTLASAPGGGPAPTTAAGEPPAPQPGPAPTVLVQGQSATTELATVEHASGPFELVLGQSVDAGWRAQAQPVAGAPSGAHAVDLGAAELVDGFANGWQVSAADLAALGVSPGNSSFLVTFDWTPQHTVVAALVISGGALVVCLIAGFLPARWRPTLRRRARAAQPRHARNRPVWVYPLFVSHPSGARRSTHAIVIGEHQPQLGSPFSMRAQRPRWWSTILVAVAGGVVAGAISSPLVGVAAGAAIAVALVIPQVRAVLGLVAAGLMTAAAVAIVRGQALHPRPAGDNWPSTFESAAVLVWMAVVFLGADALVESARHVAARVRSRRTPPAPSAAPSAAPPPAPDPRVAPAAHDALGQPRVPL